MTDRSTPAAAGKLDVVLFGNGPFASLAWHALTTDSPHDVVAFTVDRAFNSNPVLHDLPVVDFEAIDDRFDPARTAMLVSVGWQDGNRLRMRASDAARAKGFRLISHVSSRAAVASNVDIGENCMIFEAAVVQAFARIGNGVILRSGCNLAHHVEVGDWSFVAAHGTIGGGTRLGARCFVGLNATVLDNLMLGEGTTVGAGAIVHADTKSGQTCLPATRPQRHKR